MLIVNVEGVQNNRAVCFNSNGNMTGITSAIAYDMMFIDLPEITKKNYKELCKKAILFSKASSTYPNYTLEDVERHIGMKINAGPKPLSDNEFHKKLKNIMEERAQKVVEQDEEIANWNKKEQEENAFNPIKRVKVAVVYESNVGTTISFVIVEATDTQIKEGKHKETAEGYVLENMDVKENTNLLVIDSTDPANFVFNGIQCKTDSLVYCDR